MKGVEQMLERLDDEYRRLEVEQAGDEAWAYVWGGMDPMIHNDATVDAGVRAILEVWREKSPHPERLAAEFLRGYVTRFDESEEVTPPIFHRLYGKTKVLVGVSKN